jgi:hypothetical protein
VSKGIHRLVCIVNVSGITVNLMVTPTSLLACIDKITSPMACPKVSVICSLILESIAEAAQS